VWVDFEPIDSGSGVKAALLQAFVRMGKTEKVEIKDGPVIRLFYLTPLYRLRDPQALRSQDAGLAGLKPRR